MAGHKTQLPGSYGHYDEDAATFAKWGVSASQRRCLYGAAASRMRNHVIMMIMINKL